MKRLIILIALLGAGIAHAGDWGLQVHLHSMHFEDRAYEDWNEDTDGFALRYSIDDTWAVQAGHYRNEFTIRRYNFFTNYVGVDYTPLSLGPVHFGGYGWMTSGYNDYTIAPNTPPTATQPALITSESDSGIRPVAGFVIRTDYRKINLLLRLHPDLPGGIPAALLTEAGIKF